MPKISTRKNSNTQQIDTKTQLHINLEFSKVNPSLLQTQESIL